MSDNKSGGIGVLSILGLIFIALKLLKVITWSWIWVLAPFWVPIAISLTLYTVAFIAIKIVLNAYKEMGG